MIELSCDGLRVELCYPGEYYQGTRFDRAGIFRRIVRDGYVWADEWFSHADPFRHDRVCGLSEEFVTVDFEEIPVGGLFCKPGVGLLRRPDDQPYDWFRLYEIVNPGSWNVSVLKSEVTFQHILPDWYRYTKRIILQDSSHLEIVHDLEWEAPCPLSGYFYNHNFLTFNGTLVGPSRRLCFPWQPSGDWRHPYENAGFVPGGIAFTGPVDPSDAVYCGNLHNDNGPTNCSFMLKEGHHSVNVEGDRTLDYIVLWANHRVACLEPYIPLSINAGEREHWTFRYAFL